MRSAGLRAIAIIATRNESDIISQVLGDLIRQRIDIYLIDDGSTDDTIGEASRWLGRGLLEIERRPPTDTFDWTALLRRKEELAATLDADWFLHHDSDEFRESPWAKWDLLAAIQQVDSLGYNAIDFRLLNFPATHDDWKPGTDVRSAFRHFERAAPWDALQIRAWKGQQQTVDLVSSGGHEVRFSGRRVFPIPFLCRHYPIRSEAQGRRKVFVERDPRFAQLELDQGWHVQYRELKSSDAMVRDPRQLRLYDPDAIRLELLTVSSNEDKLQAAEVVATKLRQRIKELENELHHVQAEVTAQRHRQESELGALQAELTATQERLGHVSTELQAVYASRSWRLTRPLRKAYEIVRSEVRPARGDAPDHNNGVRVDFGALNRVSPISTCWGLDRGVPIDRHYIERFLEIHRLDVRGHVLEVKDSGYTWRFGDDRVTRSSVLDIRRDNGSATVVGDLAGPHALDLTDVDCFILTQTIHIIFDVNAAIQRAVEVLRPGGVLLCTLPAVSRVSEEAGGLESGDYWRFTRAAAWRVFAGIPEIAASVEVTTYGNVQACAAFLYGLAVEDVDDEVLLVNDPWFPLIHGVRAVKDR